MSHKCRPKLRIFIFSLRTSSLGHPGLPGNVVGGFGGGRVGEMAGARGGRAGVVVPQQLQLLSMHQQQSQPQHGAASPFGLASGTGMGGGREGGREGGRDRRPGGALERNENYKTTLCNHWLSNKVWRGRGGQKWGR